MPPEVTAPAVQLPASTLVVALVTLVQVVITPLASVVVPGVQAITVALPTAGVVQVVRTKALPATGLAFVQLGAAAGPVVTVLQVTLR